MEFCFVWTKRLVFGFCSSQCSIFAVKFSKTHTMVVHFSGCSGTKRKKTKNTTVLELWSLSSEISQEARFFTSFIFFDVACCAPPAHKLLTPSATPQSKQLYSPRTIGDVSSISLLLHRLFALASFFLSYLSFFSLKISSFSADCLRRNCDGRLLCSLWTFWVLSVHYYHNRIFPSKTNFV